MSIPALAFGCTACDFSASGMVIWGDYEYNISGTLIPVERELGWCSKCESLAPIEVLPTLDHLQQLSLELRELNRKLETYKSQLGQQQFWLAKILGVKPRLPPKAEDIQIAITCKQGALESQQRARLFLQGRTRPKCLLCGSESVQYLPEFLYPEEDAQPMVLPFKHPNCTGMLTVTYPSMRFSICMPKRTYNSEGLLVHEEYES